MARIWPLIRKIFKGDNNASAGAVGEGKLDVKTNKHPFQGMLNYIYSYPQSPKGEGKGYSNQGPVNGSLSCVNQVVMY